MTTRFTILLLASFASMAALARPAAPLFPGALPEAGNDSMAILILDRMAQQIGELHACSFHLSTSYDLVDRRTGLPVMAHDEHEVRLSAPHRMQVDSRGDKGHRGFWYDSTAVVHYSYTENNYVRIPAPPGIIAMIDSLHHGYGIEFPAADLLYPTFVDDLIAQSERIAYRGMVQVNGRECLHIVAQGQQQDVQVWIANDATFLPVKYVIRDHAKDGGRAFSGTFSGWTMNPDLPGVLFRFTPPPGAREVRILPINR